MIADTIQHAAFLWRKRLLGPLRRVVPTLIMRIDDSRDSALLCRCCERFVRARRYHAGFSDIVAMYCSACEMVAEVSTYWIGDPVPHDVLSPGDFGRWKLPYWRRVEDRIPPCACGGSFGYLNPPRCPKCHGAIAGDVFEGKPALKETSLYFFDFGKSVRIPDAAPRP